MDSGYLAEPVIGPATSGRTRWLGPGMTKSHGSVANCSRPVCFKVLISKVRNSLAPLTSISTAMRPAEADVETTRAPFGRVTMPSRPTGPPLLKTR